MATITDNGSKNFSSIERFTLYIKRGGKYCTEIVLNCDNIYDIITMIIM